ncbi:DEAD/DEAH box helicase [Frankia sp. CiP3]|uniref:DEAD/DEAH box helicase n=1 Tax=Frankia sp. CiP3 TaxID=2880971 RepID=UPI0035AF0A46
MGGTAVPEGAPDRGAAIFDQLFARARRRRCVTHVEYVPARAGMRAPWPAWVDPVLIARLRAAGIDAPWIHQALAAEHAHSGRSVVLATGTASGKSLGYLMPVLSGLLAGPSARALYLAPTKALANDQLRAVRALNLTGVRAATYDGDTPASERDWVRAHATFVLTNPDMLNHAVLPYHRRWSVFLRGLRYVVVDECHGYRGVFGSHIAHVLRRLRRVAARYGSMPVFVLASATVSDPGRSAGLLTGLDVEVVEDDASPRGATRFVLYEPPLTDPWQPPVSSRPGPPCPAALQLAGPEASAPMPARQPAVSAVLESGPGGTGPTGLGDSSIHGHGGQVRRSASAEAADLLVDLVVDGVRTLAFVRSRRAAEAVAQSARRALSDVSEELAKRVAAYRAGYLPEERRELEADLRSGRLLGVAATNALELGVDVTGLDAAIITGYPGTLASLWQQAGRAGRDGQGAVVIMIARDDPLDTYLVHHQEALFGRPVEATVLDPDNPYVLGPHLECAAAELPLTEADFDLFGPAARVTVDDLVRRGRLRRRPTGWYWTHRHRPDVDIRGIGGPPVRIVEASTGRLLGTVDAAASHVTVHCGAVYLHQGSFYVVTEFDLDVAVAFVEAGTPGWTTSARDVTNIAVMDVARSRRVDEVELHLGMVEVSSRVVGYQRRQVVTGRVLGEEPLDLPPRHLRTRAVWYTVTDDLLAEAEIDEDDVPGAVHAAEHAAIGILPLFATCDRWDIGGVSTALHPDTGRATVFVYDGHPGGAGFAERGFLHGGPWLRATRDVIAACECVAGCPSCVHSPKCGNGNEPLDKPASHRLLAAVLRRLDPTGAGQDTRS